MPWLALFLLVPPGARCVLDMVLPSEATTFMTGVQPLLYLCALVHVVY